MEFVFQLDDGALSAEYKKSNLEAPTIIFLHDALGSIGTWKDFPRQLAEQCQCNYLIYDRLGHGNSTAPKAKRSLDYLHYEAEVLIRLIVHTEIKKAILFGHSDGGSIALIAASRDQDNILGIITEAAHIFVEDITLQGIKEAKQLYANGDLKEKLVKYHDTKTDNLFDAWAGTWLDPKFKSWNIEHCLAHITCPCLAIQGEKDPYGTAIQLKEIKKALASKAQIVELKNIGHIPHKEDTNSVLKITSEFINNLK